MINLSPTFYTLAHILVGLLFCIAAVMNIKNYQAVLLEMQTKKIPLAQIVLIIGIAYESIFGLMLIFGILIPFAAMMLVPFVIITALMFHNFWKYQGEKRQINLSIFVMHMTVTLGSLLLLMCVI